MRLFKCPVCAQLLYFENTRCEQCGHRLGYDPAEFLLRALEQDGEIWSDPAGGWKFCANAAQEACNWLLPSRSAENYCLACRHNHIIPDLSDPENLSSWRALESAKHRCSTRSRA